jgi:hypothetical protein
MGLGATRTYSEASAPSMSSLSLFSAKDDHTLWDWLLGGGSSHTAHLWRLWAAACVGAVRPLHEDVARVVATWTRQGGVVRALLVVSVSRGAILFVTPPSMFDSRRIRLLIVVVAGWLGVPRDPNLPPSHRFYFWRQRRGCSVQASPPRCPALARR